MIDHSDAESVVEECFNQLKLASEDKYDAEKADRTASLLLVAQMKLAFLIEDAEMKAKNAKNEVTRIEGEKYFEYKTSNVGKKITENMLTSYVASDQDIFATKSEAVKQEANLKKWNYLLGTLKDAHIYFRNLSKNKWE
jgi:hypothetical protein